MTDGRVVLRLKAARVWTLGYADPGPPMASMISRHFGR
jgi:hypothetical protein